MDRRNLETDLDNPAVKCAIRLCAAFDELLKSVEYADSLNASVWEFAVELPSLWQLWISNNDLRWLVSAGFVSHALETTKATSAKRTFEETDCLRLCKQTCFVLTPKGVEFAKTIAGRSNNSFGQHQAAKEPEQLLSDLTRPDHFPKWDRSRQELLVGKIVVKRFRVPAPSQEVILAAFEEESWPARIDDPLPPRGDQCPKRRLQETIKSLNRNQRYPLLRFLGDGNARGVLWEYVSDGNGGGGATKVLEQPRHEPMGARRVRDLAAPR